MHKPNNLLEFDVQDALDWDPQLDAARVVVKADEGKVTLTGTVSTFYELQRAADDTAAVGGVKAIENELLVGLVGSAITDGELAVAANEALDRDRFVPADSVTAEVVGGYLTLHGKVRHHYQRQAAEHAVRTIDGIVGMTDNITLTSEPLPGDVAERIDKALRRNAIIGDSILVTNDGPTIFLDGVVLTWPAREEAETTAWNAPGVEQVVDRIEVVS